MARLMAFSTLTGDDKQVTTGRLDEVIQVAEAMLPLDWPGLIIHVEGSRLQNWGEPSDEA